MPFIMFGSNSPSSHFCMNHDIIQLLKFDCSHILTYKITLTIISKDICFLAIVIEFCKKYTLLGLENVPILKLWILKRLSIRLVILWIDNWYKSLDNFVFWNQSLLKIGRTDSILTLLCLIFSGLMCVNMLFSHLGLIFFIIFM